VTPGPAFIEKLAAAWRDNESLVCVGLDPDPVRLPTHLPRDVEGIVAFNRAIVDATHDLVCAFKPQIAYFSAHHAEEALTRTIEHIRTHYPHVPVILDAKRGDIGSTAEKYAAEAFKRYRADAVTVNPYMGYDSVAPFLGYADRGVIVLCRTSNPGAEDFQDLDVGGQPLYEVVAQRVVDKWNARGNCMLVVGATWPEQMARLRVIAGNMPFLVPGVGAQGGDVEKLVRYGKTAEGTGLVISSSRAVLYADPGEGFAEAARAEALRLKRLVNLSR
jgi:orotidine-5'-phosphate decarboxylase